MMNTNKNRRLRVAIFVCMYVILTYMTYYLDIKKGLRVYANKEKVRHCLQFFKTGPGQYGEGDKFLGVTVPNIHMVAKRFSHAGFDDTEKLLKSPFHEDRLAATFILVEQFEKADETCRKKIFEFYEKR